MSASGKLLACGVALAATLTGCLYTGPRLPYEASLGIARGPVRKAQTGQVTLYYPERHREAAFRTLHQLDRCVTLLRAELSSYGDVQTDVQTNTVVTYLVDANINNAYAYFKVAGQPEQIVLPVQMTYEPFNTWQLGISNVGDVACHEAVHFVQNGQTEGFWRLVNTLGGDLISPNIFTESWFIEGLATYYEARLGSHAGRPLSPVWRGAFEAGVASQGGRVNGGDLSPLDRDGLGFGSPYLVGSHFLEWLGRTHGDEKLWALVDRQGRSIFSPLGVTLRFRAIYGRTIGELLDDWSADLAQTLPNRSRPESQRVLSGELGYFAHLATAPPDGAIATLSVQRDVPARLRVTEANGTLRFEIPFTRFLPGRTWIHSSPANVSGLDFSLDGERLYFVVNDVTVDGDQAGTLVELDARSGDALRSWEGLNGLGGAAEPGGEGYVFIEVESQRANLVRLDLRTGARTALTRFDGFGSLGSVDVSPSGRIVFGRLKPLERADGGSFDLWILEPDGTLGPLRDRPDELRFDYFARWIDDRHVVWIRELDGRTQVHQHDTHTGRERVLTDVPFLAVEPSYSDGRVLFLNREGWRWTLDAVALDETWQDEGPWKGSGIAEAPGGDELLAPDNEPESPGDAPTQTELDGTASAGPIALDDASSPDREGAVPEGWRPLSDEPAPALEKLWAPTARIPWITPTFWATRDDDGTPRYELSAQVGLFLRGSDRLGIHNYALELAYDPYLAQPTAGLVYELRGLAPWLFSLSASQSAGRIPGVPGGERILQRGVTVDAYRSFWTTPVSLRLTGFERRHTTDDDTLLGSLNFVGASVSTSWSAVESSPYLGIERGLAASLNVGGYGRAVGSSVDLLDLRSALSTWLPVPFNLPSLALSARGRWLPGAPDGLLQVGGVPRGISTAFNARPSGELPPLVLPGVSFVEPFRGYEDRALRGRGALLAGARYRLPFIIDEGWASLFWLFPSPFLRQLDVEAFAEGAWIDATSVHASVGGAVFLRAAFGGVANASLYYQVAFRPLEGLPPLHVIGLAFE